MDSESLRAAQLHKEMEDRGLTGRDAIVNAAHQNREAKLNVSPEELQKIHAQHAEEHGNQPQQVVAAASQAKGKVLDSAKIIAKAEAAITFARNRLAKRSSVFEHFEVIRDVLRHPKGRIGLQDVEAALDRQKAAHQLIEVQHIRSNAPAFRYTTPGLIAVERNTIQMVHEGQGKVQPIARFTPDELQSKFTKLNEGQIQLVRDALRTTDIIFGIQGRAGMGKTTAVTAIQELGRQAGYQPLGLGPTSRATKGLREAGMEAQTLQSYLLAPSSSDQPKLFFVDESSLASSKQLHAFLHSLGSHDQVLLIGDTHQHQSIEAGRIFEELQDAGLAVAHLEQIVRQKDVGYGKPLKPLPKDESGTAWRFCKVRTGSKPSAIGKERFAAIAAQFADAPETTLVISPDNRSREEINATIREVLKERQLLGEDVYELDVLKNRQDLISEDHKNASSYQVGDSIRYHRGSDLLGIKTKSYASVVEVNADENLLTVRRADGKFVTYDPTRLSGVAVYEKEVRSFAVGDRVQFLTPWREKAISTRDTGTIRYLDAHGNARVQLDDSNRNVAWNLKDNKHLDYAYTMTSHSSQGATVDQVLVHLDTSDSCIQALINETLAYVALSRPRFDAQIFTDDASRLEKVLSRTHQNTTALSQKQIRQPARVEKNRDHQNAGVLELAV